jgi:hypothetical protein
MQLAIHRAGSKKPELFELPAGATVSLLFPDVDDALGQMKGVALNSPDDPVDKVVLSGERLPDPTPVQPLEYVEKKMTVGDIIGRQGLPGGDEVVTTLRYRK